MKELSILIPTYNDLCVSLVKVLQQQAELLGVSYEIIVADDGSTRQDIINANRAINQLPNCRMVECHQNSGRAAIRNFLTREAQYEWLLFVDSDMVVCREDFLQHYQECSGASVFDGGIVVGKYIKGNLRSMYEKAAEQKHTAEKRQATPYQHFHTANFMIRKDVMQQNPFDERFRHYGYEDVLFGKRLKEEGISIAHIDNPLSFEIFEANEHFVAKAEEGLRTLHQFSDELQGYSGLLGFVRTLAPIAPLLRLWYYINKRWERRLLTGKHPNLTVFKLYRIGYYLSLK